MKKAFLSKKVYDILKYVAEIALPALGTLYFALAKIWGLPGGVEVCGTILALDTFLASLLKLDQSGYNAQMDELNKELVKQLQPIGENDLINECNEQ